jgi:hypothetical protein
MTYDDDAPNDPFHGGKMTYAQCAERIAELETALFDLVGMERTITPDMGGKRRTFAYMRNGQVLADCLDRARALIAHRLGETP